MQTLIFGGGNVGLSFLDGGSILFQDSWICKVVFVLTHLRTMHAIDDLSI